MKTYETVILGSGFFSFAYALSHENVLILERNQLADRAFGACLRGFARSRKTTLSPAARELEGFFRQHGILTDDRVDVPNLELGLCAFLPKKEKPDILLDTLCTSVKKQDAGLWQITAVNNEGICRFSAKTLIDTQIPTGNCLNVLVKAPNGMPPLPENPDFCVTALPAFRENEVLLSFRFASLSEINRAKTLLVPYLEAIPKEEGICILASSCRMFADKPLLPYRTADGIFRIDESAFGDCLDAFEKGGGTLDSLMA